MVLDLFFQTIKIRALNFVTLCEDNDYPNNSQHDDNNYGHSGSSVLFARGEELGDLLGVIF